MRESTLQLTSNSIEKLAFSSNGVDVNVTVSIGVAACKAGFLLEKDTFLRVADEALYIGKKQGKNCVIKTKPKDKPIITGIDRSIESA